MYAIYLRSQREPIYLDDDVKGARLKDLLGTKDMPHYVEIGSWKGEGSQIKAVEANARKDSGVVEDRNVQERMNAENEYRNNINYEHSQEYKRRLTLSHSSRAHCLRVPMLMWQATTGSKDMPQDVQEQIIARQEAYFDEHPTHTYANPNAYKDILKEHEKLSGEFAGWRKSLMMLAYRVCASDVEQSKLTQIKQPARTV
jgi:hypothetical protein